MKTGRPRRMSRAKTRIMLLMSMGTAVVILIKAMTNWSGETAVVPACIRAQDEAKDDAYHGDEGGGDEGVACAVEEHAEDVVAVFVGAEGGIGWRGLVGG